MNEYPSTYDVKLVGDPQLNTLRTAMRRYQAIGTDRYFRYEHADVGVTAVCAVGAVLDADGIATELDTREIVAAVIERELSAAARQAIRALDEVAAELYPEIAGPGPYLGPGPGPYLGPLERLNQSQCFMFNWPDRKCAVLKVYREAIARREAELAAQSDALHAELAETRELVSA